MGIWLPAGAHSLQRSGRGFGGGRHEGEPYEMPEGEPPAMPEDGIAASVKAADMPVQTKNEALTEQ